MARQRQRQLLLRDAAAVIGDRDALDAAFFQPDRNLGRAGIERVFEQFLDHGRRTLDHFAGGNLRDQVIGQRLDRTRCGGCGGWLSGRVEW